jgi:hypothetical protein
MQHVSKTTINFAKSRKLCIDSDFCDDKKNSFIWICVDDDSSEPMFSMYANRDGSYSYRGNIWLSAAVREEIPAFVDNEKQLRKVLAFVANEMKHDIDACF